jgi:outer membrane protein assembly factor BamB
MILARGLPAVTALGGAALLAAVWQTDPGIPVEARVPVDRSAAAGQEPEQRALDQARLIAGPGVAADLPGSWPGFRGARRDGISDETTPLRETWPEDGPAQLWTVDLGEGYAGAAVHEGRVYVMDYDREAQADALRCLSLADGKELWRFTYPVAIKRNHGMSRTVPAVAGGAVVALGPKCHVSCLDALTGEFRWGIDLVQDYGTEVPPWYAGQCPLVEDGRVILAPAGKEVLLMAVDLSSGEVVWKTPNPRGWRMTHVSVTTVHAGGRKMYVYCGHRGVAGVAAEDGSLLWDTEEWKISIATVASPVPVPGDRIFLSGGYEAGSLMLQLAEAGGIWSATTQFRLPPGIFGATQQTPVFFEGHLYGVRPNGELVCLDLDGKEVWASGMSHRYGLGPYLIADGKILVMDDRGKLTMAKAAPDGFALLAEAQVLDGHDSWGPFALAGGRLLARDLTRMVCLELNKP